MMEWKSTFFFVAHISENTQYFLVNISRPLRRIIKACFVKNSKKIKKTKFFKKFRTIFFWGKNLKIANFSKKLAQAMCVQAQKPKADSRKPSANSRKLKAKSFADFFLFLIEICSIFLDMWYSFPISSRIF